MRRTGAALLLLCLLLVCLPASAQRRARGRPEGSAQVAIVKLEGILKAGDKKRILLVVEGEQSLTIRLTGKTRYFVGEKSVAAAAITEGMPVSVDVKRELDGSLTAVRVSAARPTGGTRPPPA